MSLDHEKEMKYIAAVPDIPIDEWAIEYRGKCPCGGKIRAIRNNKNGHLEARCDKCGFMLIE